MLGGRAERFGDVWTAACGLVVGMALVTVVIDHRVVLAGELVEGSPVRLAAATVAVHAEACTGPRDGTGVVVDTGEVWTVAHVLGGAAGATLRMADGDVEVSARSSDRLDLAAMTSPGARWGQGLAVAPIDPPVGAPVRVAGRAGGRTSIRLARVADYVGGVGPSDPTLVMRLDVTAAPGDSGGAVVDATGRVVGLVYSSQWRDRRALVIPISQIRAARLVGGVRPPQC